MSRSKKPIYKRGWFIGIAVIFVLGGVGSLFDDDATNASSLETTESIAGITESTELIELTTESNTTVEATSKEVAGVQSNTIQEVNKVISTSNTATTKELLGKSYKIVTVDGGNLSGYREANVAVNIGFGDREYWAFTNEFSQLVYVVADVITLQDPNTEKVLSNGRYYEDEAKVPGVESDTLDEGHVIADSLGGVSNAYNITPQNSTLNRHGDQAYMEKVIRDANGCTNFFATITYPDTNTMIPSHYHFEYEINSNFIVDDFDNVNPDEANASITATEATTVTPTTETSTSSDDHSAELRKIDTNGNGKVTIAEAKAAGYKMPIYNTFWLYYYMDDKDGDGKVGD